MSQVDPYKEYKSTEESGVKFKYLHTVYEILLEVVISTGFFFFIKLSIDFWLSELPSCLSKFYILSYSKRTAHLPPVFISDWDLIFVVYCKFFPCSLKTYRKLFWRLSSTVCSKIKGERLTVWIVISSACSYSLNKKGELMVGDLRWIQSHGHDRRKNSGPWSQSIRTLKTNNEVNCYFALHFVCLPDSLIPITRGEQAKSVWYFRPHQLY